MNGTVMHGFDGPLDARHGAFLEIISTLRPSLHRYCARMTGSVMDGEDVVQEALLDHRLTVHFTHQFPSPRPRGRPTQPSASM
jgi:Sigma-70 region 2